MVGVNFFRHIEVKKKDSGKRRPRFGYLVILALGLLGIALVLLVVRSPQNEREAVKPVVPPPSQEQISERAPESTVPDMAAEALGRKRVCLDIMSDIRKAIPEFVWLTSISTTSDRDYSIQGIAFSMVRVKEFLSNLEAVCGGGGEVKLSLIRRKKLDRSRVFEFSIFGRTPGPAREAETAHELVSKKDVSILIEHLMIKGESFGLKLNSFPPEGSDDRLRINLKGVGPYNSVERYLSYLSNLPQAVIVSRLVVMPVSREGIERNMANQVEASLTLDFYVEPD